MLNYLNGGVKSYKVTKNNYDLINHLDEIYGNCDSDWWSDFENQLASLNAIQYGEQIAFENRPDLLSENCDAMWHGAAIEVKQKLSTLFLELKTSFHKWIKQLKPPSPSRKIIMQIENGVFINFNYTKTLEILYNIDTNKILHIHGCIEENENFIFGHGKSYEELYQMNTSSATKSQASSLSDKENMYNNVYQSDGQLLHEYLATEAAISGVASQMKPVYQLIKKYHKWFGSLSNIKYVYIYGLSLSNVDMPYFIYFAKSFTKAYWEFSDINHENRSTIKSFCVNNEIKNYHIIELNEILDSK